MVYDAMKNFDHYAAALDLSNSLDGDGYSVYASKIRSAIEDGSTGTEILMALRFHVSEIIERIPLSERSKAIAYELFDELKKAV